MSIKARHVSAIVLAAALSHGASHIAAAQSSTDTVRIQKVSASVYRAKRPVKAPARLKETRAGSAPSAHAVWIHGFWDLQGDPQTTPHGGWVWVPGRWLSPPEPKARWDEGHWGFSDHWWSWIPGHWADHPEGEIDPNT